MKKHLSTIILSVILLAGLSLLLYPTVSDYWNSFHQSRAIAAYDETVANMEEKDYEKFLAEARAYNRELWNKPNRYKMTDAERAEYEKVLDVSGTGMMGYVEVPSIDCRLPIYHSMSKEVLQIAVGHLEGSSLPVGGEGTHAVLTAHRGLPSARLFTDLDQIREGDLFMIQVLNQTLTYQVDQIRIVLPEEMNDLNLEEGKDYCTLVTCTPYGVNSHRMLVRGHRTANKGDGIRVTPDATQYEPLFMALFFAVPILMVLLLVTLIRHRIS